MSSSIVCSWLRCFFACLFVWLVVWMFVCKGLWDLVVASRHLHRPQAKLVCVFVCLLVDLWLVLSSLLVLRVFSVATLFVCSLVCFWIWLLPWACFVFFLACNMLFVSDSFHMKVKAVITHQGSVDHWWVYLCTCYVLQVLHIVILIHCKQVATRSSGLHALM